MSVGDRLQSLFREVPLTASLICGNAIVWLLYFFGLPQPMSALGGSLDVAHAWRWITYPLASLTSVFSLAIGLLVFYWFSGALERRWGTLRFARVFVSVTLLCAGFHWLTLMVAAKSWQVPIAMSGLAAPAGAIFMIWCSLHREETILLFFVLPIKAKYLAAITVLVTFFDITLGPVASLPMTVFYVGCWFWAERYGSIGGGAHRTSKPRRSLSQWWSDRRRAKRKGRFQVLEGGSPLTTERPRMGTLQSLSKAPPAPKVEEPNHKELDRILDKIRFEGMNALTEAEKATLDSQSRRLRGDA